MGRRRSERTWRAELHDGSRDPVERTTTGHNGVRRGGGFHQPPSAAAGPSRPAAAAQTHVFELDHESLQAMVPDLPPELVRDMYRRHQAEGGSVSALVDALLELSVGVPPAPGSPQPAERAEVPSAASGVAAPRLAEGVNAAGNAEGVSADSDGAVARSEDAIPERRVESQRESPKLASLPDEIIEVLVALIGYSALGSLALVCWECKLLVMRWVQCRVHTIRIGQGSMRGWRDERVLSLLRRTRELRNLHVDGRAASSQFTMFGSLFELPVLRRLESLHLRSCDALNAEHFIDLPHIVPQLKALTIQSCEGLTEEAAAHIPTFASLTSLSLPGNLQLSRPLLQQLLRKLPSLETANFEFCGGGRDRRRSAASTSPAPRRRDGSSTTKRLGLRVDERAGASEARAQAAYDAAKLLLAASGTSAESEGPAGWEPLLIAELSLRGWQRLSFLTFGEAERMKVLNVSQCDSLALIHLEVPALQILNASNCQGLAEVTLLRAVELRSLLLSQSKSLHTLQASSSTKLETVNAFGCRSLRAECLTALLGCCKQSLRSLDLNGTLKTASLEERDIRAACPSLSNLDLRGRAPKY